MKMKALTLLPMLFVFTNARASTDQCAAYCLPSNGYSISVPNTWRGKTHYLMLTGTPYVVESASYVGLQKLCPTGYLSSKYERVRLTSNIYNEDIVKDGDYIKNFEEYAPEKCMPVVTDETHG